MVIYTIALIPMQYGYHNIQGAYQMRNPIPYKLGDIATTLTGAKVEIIEVNNDRKGYEWVRGRDSICRYNRDSDRGRTTGSEGDFSNLKNFIQETTGMSPTALAAAHAKKNAHRISKKENSGMTWTPKEEDNLKRHYGNGFTIPKIAGLHGRSELAIECRLIKLELIDENLQPIIQGAMGMDSTTLLKGKSYWSAKQITNANGTEEFPYLANHFLKIPNFQTCWYDTVSGLEMMKDLAQEQGFWFYNGDKKLYGPEGEKEEEFKIMKEEDYRDTFGKPSWEADGSRNCPYKLGNMVGRISGYTTGMYDSKDLQATIQCAKEAGVYFIDGYGQIYGAEKKKPTIPREEHSLTGALGTDSYKFTVNDYKKPLARMGQGPTGSRKYLLL